MSSSRTVVVFVVFMQAALCCNKAVTKSSSENAYERLFEDLFADYDPSVVPMKKPPANSGDNSNAINLGVSLSALNMDLDKDSGKLTLNGWLSLSWTDYRLSWEPSQYDGLATIRVPANKMWLPDPAVYNEWGYGPGDANTQLATSHYKVVVSSSGFIIFVTAVSMKLDCSNEDVWSYNENESSCHAKIGLWTFDGNHLNITTFPGKDQKMDLHYFSYNSPYLVKSQEQHSIFTKKYSCCEEPYMHVDYRSFKTCTIKVSH